MQCSLRTFLASFLLGLSTDVWYTGAFAKRMELGLELDTDAQKDPAWKKWEAGAMTVSDQHWIDLEDESLSGVPKNGFFTKKAAGTETYSIPSTTFEMSLECSTTLEEHSIARPFMTSTVKWTTSDDIIGETMWGFQTGETVVLWEKGWDIDGFGTSERIERAGGQHSHGFVYPEVYGCSDPVALEIKQFLFGHGVTDTQVFKFGEATIVGLNQQSATGKGKGDIAFEFTQSCDNVGIHKADPVSPYCFPGKKGLVVLSLKPDDAPAALLSPAGRAYAALRVTLYLQK